MGVPKLFHSLIQQYHHNEATKPTGYNIIKPIIDNNLSTHLYLDFNGGIYQCIKPGILTEETLILHVIEYLELVCKCIPNLELIYIALDGVAPLGKLKNQRERRFHSVCRNNRTNKINERFGSSGSGSGSDSGSGRNGSGIDTNMITPGTNFMYNLSLAIKRCILTNEYFTNKKVFFSDSSVPGEGEHKLIHHIRNAKHWAIDGNDTERVIYGKEHNTVIYGMDGDLIFLALSLDIDNVFLFRESGEYGTLGKVYSNGGSYHKSYLFMDICELRNAIITNFKDCYGCSKIEGHEMRRRYIDDYIFLGMLLGNDFMPKTHWFSIAEGGYERLLSAYWQIHNHTEKYLVDARTSMTINTEMLCDLMYIVKEQEQEAIIGLFAKRKKAKIWIKEDMNECERQQMLTDFYPLQHLYIEQAIEPQRDGWRDRYYKICHHMENREENRRMICQSYLKTLVWTFHYYFNQCISWDWVYNFDYAPTWTDIYEELVLHKNINISGSNKLFHFGKSEPLDTQTVLFMVLPWNSRQFMAKDIVRKLSDELCGMRIYFPKRYALNVAFHRYYHECTPIIYKMELSKVKKFIKECKLTEDELKRNLTGNIFSNWK